MFSALKLPSNQCVNFFVTLTHALVLLYIHVTVPMYSYRILIIVFNPGAVEIFAKITVLTLNDPSNGFLDSHFLVNSNGIFGRKPFFKTTFTTMN